MITESKPHTTADLPLSHKPTTSNTTAAASAVTAAEKLIQANAHANTAKATTLTYDHLRDTETASEVIRTAQKEHLDRLTQIETAITATKDELDKKYKAFLEKLESTNMDQIFKVCQEMKKSIETKLLLLTGGVGIAIILMIVSFIIK